MIKVDTDITEGENIPGIRVWTIGGMGLGVVFVLVLVFGTARPVEILVGNGEREAKTVDFKPDIKSGVVFPRWGLLLKPQREMVLSNGHILIPITVDLGDQTPEISACGVHVYSNITNAIFMKMVRLNQRSLDVMGELERIGTGNGFISDGPRSKRSLAVGLLIGKTLASIVHGGWKVYNALSKGRELRALREDLQHMGERTQSRLNSQDARMRALKKLLFVWHADYERALTGVRLFAQSIGCDLGKLEAEVQVGRWAEKWDRVITSLIIQPLNNHLVGSLFTLEMLSGVFLHLDKLYGPSNPFSACPECTLATMTVSHVGGTGTTMHLALELPNMVDRHSYLVMEPSYFPVTLGEGVRFSGTLERTLVVKDGKGFSLDTSQCEGTRSMMTCDVSVVNMRPLGPVKDWNLDSEMTMRSTPVDQQFWLAYPMYDSLLIYAAEDGTCRVRRKSGQFMTLPPGLQQLSPSDGDFAECGGYSVPIPQGAHMTPISVYGKPPPIRKLDYQELIAVQVGSLTGKALQEVLDEDKTSATYDMYMADDNGQGRMIIVNQVLVFCLILGALGCVVWCVKNRTLIRNWWAGVGIFGVTLHGVLRREKRSKELQRAPGAGSEMVSLNRQNR